MVIGHLAPVRATPHGFRQAQRPTAGRRILAIADDTTITVLNLKTGEILATHHLDPAKHYWRTTQRAPGRWPGAQ